MRPLVFLKQTVTLIVMDKKSKIFFISFALLIVASVFFSYYRFFISKNYDIVIEGECDPLTQSCFQYTCDPATEECTGNPLEDTSYYSKIYRKAFSVPMCDPNLDEQCAEQVLCHEGEASCKEVFCSQDTAEDGEECSDAEAYKAMLEENPQDDSEIECAPDDAECAQAQEDEQDVSGDSNSNASTDNSENASQNSSVSE